MRLQTGKRRFLQRPDPKRLARERGRKTEHKKKVMEREALITKYPDNPYRDFEGTRFAEIHLKERLAVVNADYFEKRLAAGKPFEDRAGIPRKDFIRGTDVMEAWSDLGGKFLVIFSYAWLTAEHPDPELYHLKRIVSILTRLKKKHDVEKIGVILDFCSL